MTRVVTMPLLSENRKKVTVRGREREREKEKERMRKRGSED